MGYAVNILSPLTVDEAKNVLDAHERYLNYLFTFEKIEKLHEAREGCLGSIVVKSIASEECMPSSRPEAKLRLLGARSEFHIVKPDALEENPLQVSSIKFLLERAGNALLSSDSHHDYDLGEEQLSELSRFKDAEQLVGKSALDGASIAKRILSLWSKAVKTKAYQDDPSKLVRELGASYRRYLTLLLDRNLPLTDAEAAEVLGTPIAEMLEIRTAVLAHLKATVAWYREPRADKIKEEFNALMEKCTSASWDRLQWPLEKHGPVFDIETLSPYVQPLVDYARSLPHKRKKLLSLLTSCLKADTENQDAVLITLIYRLLWPEFQGIAEKIVRAYKPSAYEKNAIEKPELLDAEIARARRVGIESRYLSRDYFLLLAQKGTKPGRLALRAQRVLALYKR